jgi:hypothetical protein
MPVRAPEQVFFADPALDRAFGTVMALATEVYVLRDRLQALEAALARQGALDAAALASEPSAEETAARAADRAAFVAHIMEPLLGLTAAKSLDPASPWDRSRLDGVRPAAPPRRKQARR